MPHANAPLSPLGRRRLVALVVEDSLTLKAAAAAFNVSVSTCWRWVDRWRRASEEQRADGSWAKDRSSRPHRQPARCSEELHDAVVAARQAHPGWGPRLLSVVLGMPHSTVWRCLWRRGASRQERGPRDVVRRFEWPCPGDLLQMDTKRFARFTRPGHARTGDRFTSGAEKRERVGYEFAHSIIDDHSRLAYTELHDDERADTVTGFVARALEFYAAHGITPRRLQTDNAFAYVNNNSLRELAAQRGIRLRRIPPRTPKRNGKVERYQQTLAREWAYGQTYRSSAARAQALTHWLEHYNLHRNHSGIGNQPPITRVPNLSKHNS